jgi:hypothetical protein
MSQTVFQQQLGRVLRPEPGIDAAQDRAAWIAGSSKPHALVLDFVGNAGKHSVQTAAGAYTADGEVRARVERRLAAGEDMIVSDVVREETEKVARLRRVREDAAARRAKIKVTNVQTAVDDIFLIGMGGENHTNEGDLAGAIRPRQVDTLIAMGVPAGEVAGMTMGQARARIVGIREARGLATPAQLAFLAKLPTVKHHATNPLLTKKMASALIGKGKKGRRWT